MHKVDFRMIALRVSALPLGIFICACSCALTCRFLLLGEPVFDMTGAWWTDPAAFSYIIKLSGGIAVSAAQVFGLAVYYLERETFWKWLYIGATTVSVIISVLTFQSMIQSGAINARQNTTEYQAMTADRDRMVEAIAGQRQRRQVIVEKYTAMNWMNVASKKEAEYEKRIMVYEEKLNDIQRKLDNYSASADTRDFVSASTTYDALGSDVVGFFGWPEWVGVKFSVLLSYTMLIAVSLAIDLTGTKLFSFALGEAKPEPEKTTDTTGAESGADINRNTKSVADGYASAPLTPYEKVKRDLEDNSDLYIGAESGADDENIAGPTGAGNYKSGAESGAGIDENKQPNIDVDPELLGRIIDAYATEKSINAVQNKVWDTGKSSRRREIVLAVGDAYGLSLCGGNGNGKFVKRV